MISCKYQTVYNIWSIILKNEYFTHVNKFDITKKYYATKVHTVQEGVRNFCNYKLDTWETWITMVNSKHIHIHSMDKYSSLKVSIKYPCELNFCLKNKLWNICMLLWLDNELKKESGEKKELKLSLDKTKPCRE